MKIKGVLVATALMLTTLVADVAGSHSGATGIVKQRMDAMSEMGKLSKRLADMFKGETAFDPEQISSVAELFIEHGQKTPGLFPDTKASRTGHKTEALAAIWKRWRQFTDLNEEFVRNSNALHSLTMNGGSESALKDAFTQTRKSCFNCHKKFRKPKKDR